MMTVEPTCRFCKSKMQSEGDTLGITGYGPLQEEIIAYHFYCRFCHSRQAFAPSGQSMGYSFTIKPYILYFNPELHTFKIMREVGWDVATVLQVNFCPTNLTPQNTTLEKIKTLILFS